jgi:hypothetical protein
MHIDHERNAAEADKCDVEFFFAQEQPPELGSAVPPLLACSFAWIGLEIQVMRNVSVRSEPRRPKQHTRQRATLHASRHDQRPVSVGIDGRHGKKTQQ